MRISRKNIVAFSTGLLAGAFGLADISFGQTPAPATSPTTAPASQPTTRRSRDVDPTWVPVWKDTDGNHINAHGGGIIKVGDTYYWFGEARGIRTPQDTRRWIPMPGVSCYTSKDLQNWKNEGVVLKTIENDNTHDLRVGCTIERPKVAYNESTKKYVMWFHFEAATGGYGAAKAGVAIADNPLGPYTFIRTIRPNAGKWPTDLPEEFRTPIDAAASREMFRGERSKAFAEGGYTRRDFAGGQMSRDMTLYVDDDKKAYLISSSEENYTLAFHELTPDYLDFTGTWTRFRPGGHNEAPAIIKTDGVYYMLTSGCTGWAPNDARSWSADNIMGPWKQLGNPCSGKNPHNNLGANKTFGGQSTFILPDPKKPGAYIAMFDIWKPSRLNESAHLWLPMTIEGGKMVINWTEPKSPIELANTNNAAKPN